MMRKSAILILTCAGLAACASDSSGGGEDLPIDSEYGKPILSVDQAQDGKADSFDGAYGPRTSGLSASTAVWAPNRRWYEKDDAAGLAWSANSGLTWDQKYSAWVASLPRLESGYSVTFTLTTPWGKTLPSPRLECAETAMFLRATFASWYELPFYMSAQSPKYGLIYFGHFGIVDRNGARVPGYPSFASAYKDHTSLAKTLTAEDLIARWPSDTSLRGRSLTKLADDANEFLGEDAYAGAYFDEIFLNKRAGYLLLYLLTNFGSMHLATDANTFNLAPEAVRPGDVLLERWQRQGIGHTLVVKTVEEKVAGKLSIEAMFGSMPRIQPRWYDTNLSKPYFTSPLTGGEGESFDGARYAALGGGLKRWRTPVSKNGRWYNIIPVSDRESWVDAADLDAIAARPARFEELMGELTFEEELNVLLVRIDTAREALQQHPASCSNRTRREEAFTELYALLADEKGMDAEAVDRTYRTFDDYVFPELEYSKSKTCCWNSSTSEMYLIVTTYNEVRQREAAQCLEPVAFKAVGGGYDVFADYAASIDKAAEWRAWSEDEPCPQRDVVDDLETAHAWSGFCAVRDDVLD
ncbi:MAG: hypothetical protein KC635_11830 [Myxococcales bacterium]|nr:hypothetical protein [Myxococcales bacterium]MCB9733583.1 hypothetical protein [Deltaproteobacteria bacterium]